MSETRVQSVSPNWSVGLTGHVVCSGFGEGHTRTNRVFTGTLAEEVVWRSYKGKTNDANGKKNKRADKGLNGLKS